MTFLSPPVHYSIDQLAALINTTQFDQGWLPRFPTLHNTGSPTLSQWQQYGPVTQERWGASLNAYYTGLGWHSGPHLVCCPDYVWNLCDLREDGVSVSCWNHVTIGIECVGNYEVGGDDWDTGDGAKVRDNAASTLAILCKKFGWQLDQYVEGVSGLHFHRECIADHHPCPGSKVLKADLIARANAVLAGL